MKNQAPLEPVPDKFFEVSDCARLPKRPVISVVMLAYNHAEYLAEAIEGVVMQRTSFPIELLIGDDLSPDSTREIALDYQQRFPSLIRVIASETNVGGNRNLSRLIRLSRGDVIALCEGDDYWTHENKLEVQLRVLQDHPTVDLTFHSTFTRKFDSQDCVFAAGSAVRKSDGIVPVEEVIAGDGGYMASASLVFRKSAVASIPPGMLESASIGDYILQVYGARNGGAYYVNAPMCVYRQGHPESWSMSINKRDKLMTFETSFLLLVDAMDRDLKHYRGSFTQLVYSHYSPRFTVASMRGDRTLKRFFRTLLISRAAEFSQGQRVHIMLSHVQLLALGLIKGRKVVRQLRTGWRSAMTRFATSKSRQASALEALPGGRGSSP